MKAKKKTLQQVVYVVLLFLAVVILFHWYTVESSKRIEERNKNYAADSARQTASQIDEILNNASNLIESYAYFLGESLKSPEVSQKRLKAMEDNMLFDALVFTDSSGINHASDGRTSEAIGHDYYTNGMDGRYGISVIFDSKFYDETMLCFYAPVKVKGEIIGVLRGAYLAEEYLKDMLNTTYFGEKASVHLCLPDGQVVACSDSKAHKGNLLDLFVEMEMVDSQTAAQTKAVFENGGEGAFICGSGSKTDNLCVRYLPENNFVLVQTFPKSVTQKMIRNENMVGIRLEIALICLFVIYIISLVLRANRERKILQKENREMGYIISGVNTLFTRFIMVDLENDTYQYLAGTRPEDRSVATHGSFKELSKYLCSLIIEEEGRLRFAQEIDKDTIIREMDTQDGLRYECHVLRKSGPEWEHVNIICLERKSGKAAKVLFIRQNTSELKEKELRIQAEMALAERKERQYRIAITSNAFCTYEFNLNKDRIENDIILISGEEHVSVLAKLGLQVPCKASEFFERWKEFVLEESLNEYCAKVDIEYMKERFRKGEAEINVDYWSASSFGSPICIRQSFVMTQDYETEDIMVMVVSKEITEQVQKQREQTQALQDALM